MHLAASSVLVIMKCGAINQSTNLKKAVCIIHALAAI
jgi:hypothetical protein